MFRLPKPARSGHSSLALSLLAASTMLTPLSALAQSGEKPIALDVATDILLWSTFLNMGGFDALGELGDFGGDMGEATGLDEIGAGDGGDFGGDMGGGDGGGFDFGFDF